MGRSQNTETADELFNRQYLQFIEDVEAFVAAKGGTVWSIIGGTYGRNELGFSIMAINKTDFSDSDCESWSDKYVGTFHHNGDKFVPTELSKH